MELPEIESKFRDMLLPVLGLDTIDEVQPEQSLVLDLGADSLDFVEMMYEIEQNFGVILKTNEIVVGGESIPQDNFFEDGKLTKEGYGLIKDKFTYDSEKMKEGMSKIDLFSIITVRDMAKIIEFKVNSKDLPC